jgi:hypothetical protein
MAYYTATLLDIDGCLLASTERDSRREAIAAARALLEDERYRNAGAHKAEVHDEDDECIWDQFVQAPANPDAEI